MPSINYKRFRNEPDDEENIGISVIEVPEHRVEPPSTFTTETDIEERSFHKYSDCFKSTALTIYVKMCILLVVIVHLVLAMLGLRLWYTHKHNGSLSQNK